MDDKLVPFMALLSVVLLVVMVVSGFSFWRTRRNVARNVVHAALTRRQLDAAQCALVDAARELLVALRVKPEAFGVQPPVVHFALQAMAMRKLGITPVGLAKPFSALDSPYLARSVQQHIRVVRFHAENTHGVTLSELDAPASGP